MSKSDSYLGIDFDNNSVKIVELKNENGRPRLITYGFIDQAVDRARATIEVDNIGSVAEAIKSVCKRSRTTTTKVVSALPAFSVFSSILTLPNMSKKDLGSAVRWEAKKVVPLPIEEMILDWKLLEGAGNEALGANESAEEDLPQAPGARREFLRIKQSQKGNYSKVLLTAAPKDLVRRYLDIFKAAGLQLLSLDTEAFALVRSLVGNDKSALMIVDLGAVVTTITVVVNGIPILNRSLDVGGVTITKSIANSLNISLERAEQFKYDIGISPSQQGQGTIPKTIEAAIGPIVDEIIYSLNLYKSQDGLPIEKVILTGGTSLLLNLPEYLTEKVNLKVFRGDPWARIIYPEELRPVLDEIGARFSVANGLAMRDIE